MWFINKVTSSEFQLESDEVKAAVEVYCRSLFADSDDGGASDDDDSAEARQIAKTKDIHQ